MKRPGIYEEGSVRCELVEPHRAAVRKRSIEGWESVFLWYCFLTAAVATCHRRNRSCPCVARLPAVPSRLPAPFSGQIVVDTALAQRRVSGTIAIADTDAALAFIKQALGVKATRIGPLVIIR